MNSLTFAALGRRGLMHGAIALIAAVFVVVSAKQVAAQAKTIDSKAEHAILIDAESGAVLFEKAADELTPPASMSKIMTMVMVFEALERGELTLDSEFVISEDAWRRGGASSGGSTMYAELNSSVRLEDLIKGVVIQSANDACIAIAEGMAGSEAAFADLMTERGRELGMDRSVFTNATGLPGPEHLVTVRELAMLARHQIYTLKDYYHYYSQTEFTWNKIKQRNRNPLLYQNMGADGLKTGYIRASGYGLVASAVRNNKRLILVMNGLKSTKNRASEARKLMDWGFRHFKTYTLFKYGQEIGDARVWGGKKNWVPLTANKEIRLMLSPLDRKKIRAELVYKGPVRAPVKKGDQLGKIRFVAQDATIAEIPLFATED
ncbi:MAG: D-alanyl-D-alanine carboxypeptidase family protein, partial [Hyphomicrobiales bacterium]